MNFKKEVLLIYPHSTVEDVNGYKIVFVRGEDDNHGTALIKPNQVNEDMDPWEQAYRAISVAS